MSTAWEVTGVDGYNKPLCAPVYLTAASQDAARRAGKELLRAFGVPGRMLRRMRARIYKPDEDREWHGYLRKLPNEKLKPTRGSAFGLEAPVGRKNGDGDDL
jgi:hypothetical protein